MFESYFRETKVARLMNFQKTILSMVTAFSLMLGLSACGDNGAELENTANIVSQHYDENPPKRGWKVLSVQPVPKENKVQIQILVTQQQDIDKLKSLSRMDQLAVAKLSCPMRFEELRTALGSKNRLWVELRANNKSLVNSICAK